MSNVTKLSLAVGLALAAAALNAMWLNAEKKPPQFVAAKSDIKPGAEITDAMLTAVPVPGDLNKLRGSLIPYANRAILFGLKTSREYTRGDVFFQRDIQAPMELAQFEVLGPFRLISVGERFTDGDAQDARFSSGANNVTIAVNADFDDRTRRLLEIIDPSRRTSRDKTAGRIVAVQVIPKEEQSAAAPAADKNVVYQTVSLDGIDNVPRVLLAGDLIRFVVPANESL